MTTVVHPVHSDHFLAAWTDEVHESVQKNDNADTSWYMTSGKSKALPQGEDADWWLENGPAMVTRWHEFREDKRWPVWVMPDGTPAIELDILATVGRYPVKAIIDRVFNVHGVPVIVDIKTGRREPDDLLQLGVYRVALAADYGLTVDFGAYWMARSGKLSALHDIRRYTPELLTHYFDQYAAGVGAGVFLPHLSAMCRACAMRNYCNAYGGKSAEVDPDSERSHTWETRGTRSN